MCVYVCMHVHYVCMLKTDHEQVVLYYRKLYFFSFGSYVINNVMFLHINVPDLCLSKTNVSALSLKSMSKCQCRSPVGASNMCYLCF